MRAGYAFVTGLLVFMALSAGCTAHRVERGQRDLRHTVMSLHEDQLIDNLVRLRKGLPIAHLDYTSLYAEMSDTTGATANLDYTDADNALKLFPGAAVPPNNSLANDGAHTTLGKVGASTSLVNKLTLTAAPVQGKNVVYGAYLNFNDLPPRHSSCGTLRSLEGPVPSRPPPEAAVLSRQYHEGWWYVPAAFRAEFRDLGLAVNNLNREPPVLAKKILIRMQRLYRLSPDSDAEGKPVSEHSYLAHLSIPLPPDSGFFFARLNATGGVLVRMELLPATQSEITGLSDGRVSVDRVIFERKVSTRPTELRDEPSHEVIFKLSADVLVKGTSLAAFEQELLGLTKGVEIRLDAHEVPPPEPVEDLLRSLNEKLDQIILRGR